jgi:hypothetical protein
LKNDRFMRGRKLYKWKLDFGLKETGVLICASRALLNRLLAYGGNTAFCTEVQAAVNLKGLQSIQIHKINGCIQSFTCLKSGTIIIIVVIIKFKCHAFWPCSSNNTCTFRRAYTSLASGLHCNSVCGSRRSFIIHPVYSNLFPGVLFH